MMLYRFQRTFKFILTGKSHNTLQGRGFGIIIPKLQGQEVILPEVRKLPEEQNRIVLTAHTIEANNLQLGVGFLLFIS